MLRCKLTSPSLLASPEVKVVYASRFESDTRRLETQGSAMVASTASEAVQLEHEGSRML